MANVKEVSVEVSFTKNLGNYQSIKPTAGVVMTVEPGDDVNKVFTSAWNLAGDQVQSQLALFDETNKSGVKRGL
jgi:hypothetical protein